MPEWDGRWRPAGAELALLGSDRMVALGAMSSYRGRAMGAIDMGRRGACVLGCLAMSACLIADNPRFVDSNSDGAGAAESSEGGDSAGSGTEAGESEDSDCPPGLLDCDNDGECEAEDDALSSCGECGHVCEYPDAFDLACDAGVCVGFDLPAAADVTLVEGEMSESAGSMRLFANGPDPDPRREILMRFETPAFDAGVEVVGADLFMYSHNVTPPIGAHLITQSWEDETAVWPGPDYVMMAAHSIMPSGGPIEVPFDAAVDWWDGVANFGVRMRSMSDNPAQFDSAEGAEPPRLRVELHF